VLVFPVGLFFFFEGVMRISMPSGMSFTDPVFTLLYDIIY
jgi:putative tricarboxylic transport membrane protein